MCVVCRKLEAAQGMHGGCSQRVGGCSRGWVLSTGLSGMVQCRTQPMYCPLYNGWLR